LGTPGGENSSHNKLPVFENSEENEIANVICIFWECVLLRQKTPCTEVTATDKQMKPRRHELRITYNRPNNMYLGATPERFLIVASQRFDHASKRHCFRQVVNRHASDGATAFARHRSRL
jgi:hypothetical protein